MKRISISIVLLACLVAPTAAQSDSGVMAYWTDYEVKKNNWDLHASNVACAAVDGDNDLEWRSKYGWTAYCGSVGPQGKEACGKCLSVTNTETGDQITVRVVDTCGINGLVLDLETVFKPLDSNGNGMKRGHLVVDFEFVDCDAVPDTVESDAIAFWTEYNVKKNNWDLNAANVACAALDGDKPLEWRSKYGWTGFCGKVGPQGLDACGKCLMVTNTATNAQETVRIVDTCGLGGLVMDRDTAFVPIDTDGNGIINGHLNVHYKFVDCGDSSQENKVLFYSQKLLKLRKD